MNRDKFIGRKDYKTFAGISWPTYEDFITGAEATNPDIQQEIDQFVEMMKENYQALTVDLDILADSNAHRQQHQFHNYLNYIQFLYYPLIQTTFQDDSV